MIIKNKDNSYKNPHSKRAKKKAESKKTRTPSKLDGETRWISPDEIVDEFSGYKRRKG